MPVNLIPPITGYPGRIEATALTEGPRFIRTPAMRYWHRPRSAFLRHSDVVTVFHMWCGQHVFSYKAVTTETAPAGQAVCATCDGRAVGAGQEEGPAGRTLALTPRHLAPPRYCPGSRTGMFEELSGGRVGRCLVCGDHGPLRGMGGPYYGHYGIVQHDPGPALVTPCPFHRWRQLSARDGRIYCPCGTELKPGR